MERHTGEGILNQTCFLVYTWINRLLLSWWCSCRGILCMLLHAWITLNCQWMAVVRLLFYFTNLRPQSTYWPKRPVLRQFWFFNVLPLNHKNHWRKKWFILHYHISYLSIVVPVSHGHIREKLIDVGWQHVWCGLLLTLSLFHCLLQPNGLSSQKPSMTPSV